MPEPYLLFIIFIALAFDFINGFHDAANSIATVVSTRVLTPKLAVLWAAAFNFIAAFGMGTMVAATIGKGIVLPQFVDRHLVLAALVGAIVWNLITWYYGLPSSSSHALMGGLAGAGLMKGGTGALVWWETTSNPLVYKGLLGISMYIVIAPLLGFVLGLIFMMILSRLCWHKAPRTVDNWFRRLQLASAAVYSYSHGANDAQKTMGIIYALMVAAGMGALTHREGIQEFRGRLEAEGKEIVLVTEGSRYMILPGDEAKKATDKKVGKTVLLAGHLQARPDGKIGLRVHDELAWWIILSCHAAIALGTYFGGWRIVRTMGSRITKLDPFRGFCAETGGGVTLLAVSHFGIPVSTTHTITGAIVGVGSAQRLSAVRWGVARRVVWAWVFTIPASGIVAALVYLPFKLWAH